MSHKRKKKIRKKSCRLRRRPIYVDLALFGFFGTFAFFFAKILKKSRKLLCFHPYRPWVGSVTQKKFTEAKCSKLDPQKEPIDPKMAIKVPKVQKKSFFWHRLSQMSSNEWIITKKFKSETLHPKRVPFHPELPCSLDIQIDSTPGSPLLDQDQAGAGAGSGQELRGKGAPRHRHCRRPR